MDGRFVPNISFGFPIVEAVASAAQKPLDAHLMIEEPWKYIPRFLDCGVSMLSFHLEACRNADPSEIAAPIRERGVKAGLVINPDVPVSRLFPYLDSFDFIMIMSVFAGFAGQAFIPGTYERIKALRQEIVRRGVPTFIEVDGGVDAGNAEELAACGASVLVAGSSFFKAADKAGFAAVMKGQGQ